MKLKYSMANLKYCDNKKKEENNEWTKFRHEINYKTLNK